MRRGLATLIMGLSLLVASATWAGFVLSHTVLDASRSEALADHLLDDQMVRSVIISRIADAMESQIPANVPTPPRQTLELVAAAALDDPRVEALVRDGIVRSYQNALAGKDDPIELDATVVGQAARDALIAAVPALKPALPQAPPLKVEIPGAGLSWLGTVKHFVDRFILLGALVSLAGVTTSFLVARNRAAALRRVAFWCFGASAFWLAMGYAAPALARAVAPSSAAIASAAVDVFFGSMIRPAVIMAAIGVGLLGLSFLWPALSRRRPAAQLDRAARARSAGGRDGTGERAGAAAGRARRGRPPTSVPVGGRLAEQLGVAPEPTGPAYDQPYPVPAGYDVPRSGRKEPTAEYPVISGPRPVTGPPPMPPLPSAPGPLADPTAAWGSPDPARGTDPAWGSPDPARGTDPAWGSPVPGGPAARPAPRDSTWVEGVGYLDADPTTSPFDRPADPDDAVIALDRLTNRNPVQPPVRDHSDR